MQADNVQMDALTDQITLGVLAASVPREVVDATVRAAGRQALRRDGKMPPALVVLFVMGLALWPDDDYEEVADKMGAALDAWGLWSENWPVTAGGLTQARQRLGYEPVRDVFGQVARPVATELTRGAFLGQWLLVSIDGFEWDVPDTAANAAEFGYSGQAADDPARPAFPKARVVTISECGSHAVIDAEIGGVAGKGTGEQSLARKMWPRLQPDWLLIADRNFYNWEDWCAAADTGAQLLWRVKADLKLPVVEMHPDGSCTALLVKPGTRAKARDALLRAARHGEDLDPGKARLARVVEYKVPDRDGDGKRELIALITTITRWQDAPADTLAAACHQRWEHETGNAQLKTHLRGPGRILRSKSPDMVRQEIYGYLLTHHALSTLICEAATEAGVDPDQIKFKRTVRIIRRAVTSPAFSPSGT